MGKPDFGWMKGATGRRESEPELQNVRRSGSVPLRKTTPAPLLNADTAALESKLIDKLADDAEVRVKAAAIMERITGKKPVQVGVSLQQRELAKKQAAVIVEADDRAEMAELPEGKVAGCLEPVSRRGLPVVTEAQAHAMASYVEQTIKDLETTPGVEKVERVEDMILVEVTAAQVDKVAESLARRAGDDDSTAGARPQFEALMGSAGTGKTYLARKIIDQDHTAELCATTGIAALNLGAGVTTLNSLVGYFDTANLRDMWITGALTRKLGRLIGNGVRRLVIDEMSMMDGEQLSIFVQAAEELTANDQPFGITLVGDFCQLPPVKAKYAFEVDEWSRFAPHINRLTKVHRQTDVEFIQALQAVRRGDREAATAYFGPKVERTLVPDFKGTTILAKNAEVDRYNMLRHSQVQGERHEWAAHRWGKERSEWKNVPPSLGLKVGALVMVLANLKEMGLGGQPTGEYEYVNGDLGELVGKTEFGAQVKLHRDGRVVDVMSVVRENLVPCDKERRKELKSQVAQLWDQKSGKPPTGVWCLKGDRQEWEVLGQLQYMPLRLAYATTVHKSQGLTLDEVQLSIADHFWETGGMLYVGLSRARTAGGLRIVGSPELFRKRICVDPRVKEWV